MKCTPPLDAWRYPYLSHQKFNWVSACRAQCIIIYPLCEQYLSLSIPNFYIYIYYFPLMATSYPVLNESTWIIALRIKDTIILPFLSRLRLILSEPARNATVVKFSETVKCTREDWNLLKIQRQRTYLVNQAIGEVPVNKQKNPPVKRVRKCQV